MIEYIGTIIRSEVANRKERLTGVYMFRIDNDFVIDATSQEDRLGTSTTRVLLTASRRSSLWRKRTRLSSLSYDYNVRPGGRPAQNPLSLRNRQLQEKSLERYRHVLNKVFCCYLWAAFISCVSLPCVLSAGVFSLSVRTVYRRLSVFFIIPP
ncbi:hypothetical protein F7725_029229 [Dissostichus mawsoni]|uniref:Uncharacterized protein n=1 Tax=Dissostichus mawsoni TaxID=36200 RepID=A0A7J5XIB8_DISMA|nr:hypothetical protein F7725_029229 [Dissostichus mawsoni]